MGVLKVDSVTKMLIPCCLTDVLSMKQWIFSEKVKNVKLNMFLKRKYTAIGWLATDNIVSLSNFIIIIGQKQ